MHGIAPTRTLSEPGAITPTGMIPLCEPAIDGNAWAYVKECLESNWVSSAGPFVDRLERQVADYLGVPHAVATVSGTAALHIALLVADVAPDDEVLVSALTFIAPANAIRYCGAWPVFIDAEPRYWQMDPERVAHFLTRQCRWKRGVLWNKTTGRRVRAILPVHILGHPVDMDPLLELAHAYELPVIEDASEGLGAQYKGRKLGRLGTIACLSFNGNKMITTGGGGMLVTEHTGWAQRARYLTTQAKDDPVEYIHGHIGYNYRLTNLQAALGCAQMEQLAAHIAAKRHIAATYTRTLQALPGLQPLGEAAWAYNTYWLYTVLVDPLHYGHDRRALMRHLGRRGIQTRPLWQPLHRSPAHRSSPRRACPVASRLQRQALSLPCSVRLGADQERVIEALQAGTSSPHVVRSRGASTVVPEPSRRRHGRTEHEGAYL